MIIDAVQSCIIAIVSHNLPIMLLPLLVPAAAAAAAAAAADISRFHHY
jgi:hypothetical protein